MKRAAYLKAAAVAAVLAAGLGLGGICGFASSVRIGSSTDGTDSLQTQVMDNGAVGPVYSEVDLGESYHDDFEVYEESIAGNWFFYTNVSNGGITDSGVYLDIPANISYEMERDGVPVSYASRQTVTARGSYVVTLTVTEGEGKPFNEQSIYTAVFRFRIQEKPVKPLETEPESSAGGSTSFGGGSQEESRGDMSYEQALEIVRQAEEAARANGFTTGETEPETSGAAETEETSESPSDLLPEPGTETEPDAQETEPQETGGEVMDDDGRIDEERLEQAIGDLLGGGYGELADGFNEETGMVSAYDEASGYYKHELASKAVFYTDVPNGMITRYSVTILTNDEIEFQVLKDGEPYEYTVGTQIEEAGSYLVYPSQTSTIYLTAYANRRAPVFQFRIIPATVNDIGIFNAPEHASIRSVLLNDTELPASWLHEDWCYLGGDGLYEIELQTEAGDVSLSFNRDTVAPRFSAYRDGNAMQFIYNSEDTEGATVIKDNSVISSESLVSKISDPGQYTVRVYDGAGNQSSLSFDIEYHMNTAAIVAVFMIIILVIGGAIAVKRLSRQLKVR